MLDSMMKTLTMVALLGLAQVLGVSGSGVGSMRIYYSDSGNCGSDTAANVHSHMLVYDTMVEVLAAEVKKK